MYCRSLVLLILVASLICGKTHAQDLWVGKDGNIRNIDTRDMVISPSGLYLATSGGLYAAPDAKARWQSIFTLPPGDNEINSIAVPGGHIFIGTKRGLYRSSDGGATWRNVFRTIIPEKNFILAIEVSGQGKLVISTCKGVFESRDAGRSWTDIGSNLGEGRITCLALNKEDIYAGGDDGLFLRKAGSHGWERIYVSSAPEGASGEAPPDNTEEDEAPPQGVRCISFKAGRLYAVVPDRIIYSDDGGMSWNELASSGLSGAINHLAVSKGMDRIYCATSKGVFSFDKMKSSWSELYRGMDKVYGIRKVILEGEDERSLWALSSSGLFRFESVQSPAEGFADVERGLKSFRIICENEPSFRQLQAAAMKFADVEPDKIRRWHTESRLRALLPKISMGMDSDKSNTYEIYTSATRDYVVSGPEDISSGFDVSVSWELADLIWSDDQANIDVRSRLTTQLRNDVLDDLRRAYYERKRLQFELLQSPPKDLRPRLEKELRIQELGQAIDDLTGNYLSEHTRAIDVPKK